MSPSVLDEEIPPTGGGRKTGAIDGIATTAGTGGGAPPRPNNVKRAKPASACTPPPPVVPLETRKEYQQSDVEELLSVLATFSAPEEDELPKVGESIAPHQMSEVELLFSLVAKVGNSLLPWETIRPVFLWKIRHVMEEMVRVEKVIDERVKEERKASGADEGPPPPPPPNQVRGGVPYRPPAEGWEDDGSELRESYKFILGKAASFTAAPFTFQRLCELLSDPLRHYKKAETFFRALEKCINVVTCVTETGLRITGTEEDETDENDPPNGEANGRVEHVFFGRVDEVDDAMDTTQLNPVTVMPGTQRSPSVSEGGGGDGSVEGEEKMESNDEEDKPLDMSRKEDKKEE